MSKKRDMCQAARYRVVCMILQGATPTQDDLDVARLTLEQARGKAEAKRARQAQVGLSLTPAEREMAARAARKAALPPPPPPKPTEDRVALYRQRFEQALAGRVDEVRTCTACYERFTLTAVEAARLVATGQPFPRMGPCCYKAPRCRRCGRPSEGLCPGCRDVGRGHAGNGSADEGEAA
jgi:hypothetical protein